ncbi:hypothetical protein H0W91_00715 [Patescibacteria group bacterium]|nr:hypothetical protein [Patescibacteria group bacterium]
MENVTFGDVKTQVVELAGMMKTVSGFRLPDAFQEGLKIMASFVKDGKLNEATKAGKSCLETGRGILRAFLRNSVLDQEERPGKPAKVARFNVDIKRRASDQDGAYDGDIIARLEKFRGTLEEAVKTETNGVFIQRVSAYNAMVEALKGADVQQKQLDRTRLETQRQKMKTTELLDKRPASTKPVNVRVENILAKEVEVQKRANEAKELLDLIGV